MNISRGPEGWTDTEYKSFRVGEDDTSDSDSGSDSDEPNNINTVRGYRKEKFNKILFIEELLPE
jgi:hypothetical protein